jgi:hypothetical protein
MFGGKVVARSLARSVVRLEARLVGATRKVTLSIKSYLFKFQDPEKVRTIVGMSSTS